MISLRARTATVLALVLATGTADAALRCRVSTVPMDFGVYSPLAASPLDGIGTVTARCQGGTGVIRFHLSPGNSGNAGGRLLINGTSQLPYNIYVDAPRTRIWGDGTGGTSEAVRIQTRRGRTEHDVTAYGRIPPGQDATPGAYSDDIVVTVIF
jgi:spore coat protein U-like protein